MLCAMEVPTAFSACKGGSYKIVCFCVKEVCACLYSVCALLHTYLSRSHKSFTLLVIISFHINRVHTKIRLHSIRYLVSKKLVQKKTTNYCEKKKKKMKKG